MFIAGSVALHGGAFAVISQATRRDGAEPTAPRPLELVVIEVENRPPPPIEEVKAPPTKPVTKAPIKVASVKSPKPKELAPPPPNETPPAATPPKQAPLVVGMTMSSTTTGGSFAAPVGNTLYGKAETKAPAPEEVQSYSASRFVPIYQVDSQPTVLHEEKIPYPPGAQRERIEGTVLLSVVIDAEGNVVSTKVLTGPGHGLDEAARDAFRRFRFKPAIKSGQPVSTEMKYKYTFSLN
ncbi:MAG TPA: TonB family protein [Myxococcaceae bacterium]|nr:TonB family protein [Myxococcaceae bacterium]